MRQYIPYITGFLLLLGIAVFIQSRSEKPMDWTPSYTQFDKIPYGTYITRKVLPQVFPKQAILENNQSPYMLSNDSDYRNTNFIFLSHNFNPDEYDSKKLLALADSGNDLFIMAENFDGKFADSLKLVLYGVTFQMKDTSVFHFNFTHKNLTPQKEFVYKNNLAGMYFNNFDTAKTTILGERENEKVNFIKIRYGKGNIYLHTVPVAFTNYYLVDKKTRDYPFYCLSYLPLRPVVWDEYYLKGSSNRESPLRFVMSNEPLRWAFWILILSLLVYVVFEAKRQQRIIPIIEPYKNTTLEFAETLGRLYYNRGDHQNLLAKKILFFYDFLRTKLYLKTDKKDDEFYKRFREKTGMSSEETASLFINLGRVEALGQIEESDLMEISEKIDKFYSKLKIK